MTRDRCPACFDTGVTYDNQRCPCRLPLAGDTPDYGTPPKYGAYDAAHQPEGSDWTPETAIRRVPSTPEPRREPAGIVLAVFLLVSGAVFAGLALMGGWWVLLWALAAPFLLFGAVGLAIDVPKVPRDENGRPL